MMFFKSQDVYAAIKLYSIGFDQKSIDREVLVNAILYIFESQFNEYPSEYDIHGPYKIPKGKSIKLNTFKKKLSEFGHENYTAYHGFTENRLGFDVSFDAKVGDSTTYTEIIVWYNTSLWGVEFKDVVSLLIGPLSVSSGCMVELRNGYHISTESKIRKGLLGGTSITIKYDHLRWIEMFKEGASRQDCIVSLLNKNQLNKALIKRTNLQSEAIGNLYVVTNNA